MFSKTKPVKQEAKDIPSTSHQVDVVEVPWGEDRVPEPVNNIISNNTSNIASSGTITPIPMAIQTGETQDSNTNVNSKGEFLKFLQKNNIPQPSFQLTLTMDTPPYSCNLSSGSQTSIKACEAELFKLAYAHCQHIKSERDGGTEEQPNVADQNGKTLLFELLQKRLKTPVANLVSFTYSHEIPLACTVSIAHPTYSDQTYVSTTTHLRKKEAESDACMQAYLALRSVE